MSPNPRYLGQDPLEPNTIEIEELTVKLAHAEAKVALMMYPEWSEMEWMAKEQELDAIKGLAAHAQDMVAVENFRAKLRICLWLQELPDLARIERDNLVFQLKKLLDEVPKEE